MDLNVCLHPLIPVLTAAHWGRFSNIETSLGKLFSRDFSLFEFTRAVIFIFQTLPPNKHWWNSMKKKKHKNVSSGAGSQVIALELTGVRKTWVFVLASLLAGSVTLGKSFMPQFPHM